MKVNELLEAIDYELIAQAPPMDDYDAGVIEGLRIAREIVTKGERKKSKYKKTEDFRYHTRVM